MKKFPRLLLCLFLLVATTAPIFAGRSVHVRAYTRRDGTYVRAHERNLPAGSASTPSVSVPSAPVPYVTAPRMTTPRNLSTSSNFTPATDPANLPENWVPDRYVGGKFVVGHYRRKTSVPPPVISSVPGLVDFGSMLRPAQFGGNGGVQRDANGRIKRSESAKHTFMRMTGFPNGRPGYVVDHIIPLKRGGADDPSNMQWQTVEEAKAKDKWE